MKKPERKGFRIEVCRGALNCPNPAHKTEAVVKRITALFEAENLLSFLQAHLTGPIAYHHEFRVAVSDCPNACSRPQIQDIGIIGAMLPKIVDIPCAGCEACSRICREQAIVVNSGVKKPVLNSKACVKCGQCISHCPARTLAAGEKGFRVLVGGKLGRHPQLATELPGIYSEDVVVSIVSACLAFYKQHGHDGRRFGAILNQFGLDEIMPPD